MEISSEKNTITSSQYKICVSGAAKVDHCGAEVETIARQLGREIAQQGAVLVDGATSGFPLFASQGAKEVGGVVIGFSPAATKHQHEHMYRLPTQYHDVIIYTGFGYSGRDIILTQSSDAVIIGCGRIGTFHEFTTAFEDRRPIGVLEGAWATHEIIKDIISKARGEHISIAFDSDPGKLVKKVIALIKEHRLERETEQDALNEIRDLSSQ